MRTLCFFPLLMVFVGAWPVGAADPPAKRVALLVGVDRYDHSGLENLQYAGRDAVELGKVLVANGFTTRVLTSTAKDRLATKTAIEAALRDACKDLTRQDVVLFAFSGQGLELTQDRGTDVYLCPTDANPFDPATLVSVTTLLKTLGDSGAGACCVLLDACRNDPSPGRGPSAADFTRFGVRPNVGILLSCSANQRAYENKAIRHGVFTSVVLDGLNGKATDAAGEVTWEGLVAYVRKTVPKRVVELAGEGRTQQPHAISNMAGPPVVLVSAK